MNRLILVGNGFDLAHNLKTSYCDFITDYICNSINKFYEDNSYEDQLLKINWRQNNVRRTYTLSSQQTAIADLKLLVQNDKYAFAEIKSKFLSNSISQIEKINWVDLENDYFEQLILCKTLDPHYINGKQIGYIFDSKKVKKLNNELDNMKDLLEKYLHKQTAKIGIYPSEYSELFREPIKKNDIVTLETEDHVPEKILLLSFNYTSILHKYFNVLSLNKEIETHINYIHGELNSKKNPIIFGFGDEYNKNYLEFEDLRNKEILKHIKSFGYFKTSNYHNLMRFIDAGDFQVYILGHSLGLSDRTMLKQIFEHPLCRSIKIFYYQKPDGTNDYTDKTFDISSHFSDKGMMRKKIVPFNLSEPMPQIKDLQ